MPAPVGGLTSQCRPTRDSMPLMLVLCGEGVCCPRGRLIGGVRPPVSLKVMNLLIKALIGGALIPILYLALFAGASSLVMWTYGDDHPSLLLLTMPLLWPAVVISRVSQAYGVNALEDYLVASITTMLAANYLAYTLLSYVALRWYEGRRRLS